MWKKLVLHLLSIGIVGCAGMQEAVIERFCHESGGYERGMNDARQALPMDQSFITACAPDIREAVGLSYRNGYKDGLASVQAEKPQTSIQVNIGSGSTKKYLCKLKPFVKSYSAWGATELEARDNVQKQCETDNHEMHCDNNIICKSSE